MEALITALLRPYRATYSLTDLGPIRTPLYCRQDLTLPNPQTQLLHLSYFQHTTPTNICVVYCHCNSGSRVQGMQYVSYLIEQGWNVCLFDFSGSGHSEGSHISLGHFQARDLEVVIKYVRSIGNKKILLWGRSMGAATIIFHLSEVKNRQDICGCVLDSPYSSLWSLMRQLGKERSKLPGFLLQPLLDYLRRRIKQEYMFDLRDLEPIKKVGCIDTPLFFITSQMDEFVRSQDVVQLYKQSSSKNKLLQFIDKSHNSSRDPETIRLSQSFLHNSLQDRLPRNQYTVHSHSAGIIIKAEQQKKLLRRMKSQTQLRTTKLNPSRKPKGKDRPKEHFKTEISRNLDQQQTNRVAGKKKKAIKFSLANVQFEQRIHSLSTQPDL